MMFQVPCHILLLQTLKVAPADDPRSQRTGGEVHELIEEVVLAGEDDGQNRF